MPLGGSSRDASFLKKINRELITRLIDTEVAVYKLSLEDTKTNMYDESDNKVYYSPVRINALIRKDQKTYTGDEFAYDSGRTAQFGFNREDLKDIDLVVEEGDIIYYDNEYYEVDETSSSQYWAGKNPSTDIAFTESQRSEFGHSVSIVVTAHVTKRNRLNIQEVRSGINKPNNLPKFL